MEYKTGLWKKTSKKGNEYYTSKIKINNKEYKITLFENKRKENEKQPDYNLILESKEQEKKSTATDEQVYADFGNEVNSISDEDLAF